MFLKRRNLESIFFKSNFQFRNLEITKLSLSIKPIDQLSATNFVEKSGVQALEPSKTA